MISSAKTIAWTLITATIAVALPLHQAVAEEVFYDIAPVISTKPLYETKTVPITTEQCDHEDNDATNQSEKSSTKGLIDAIRGSGQRYAAEKHQPHCQTITRYESQEEIVTYKVRYEYGDEVYERRMDRDPGEFVRVRVRLDPRP